MSTTPTLPCPECRVARRPGSVRIGNRRSVCPVCNAFAQAVYTRTRTKLAEMFPDEYEALRLRSEVELYPAVIDTFLKKHPEA